jgi:hypothetical protein
LLLTQLLHAVFPEVGLRHVAVGVEDELLEPPAASPLLEELVEELELLEPPAASPLLGELEELELHPATMARTRNETEVRGRFITVYHPRVAHP